MCLGIPGRILAREEEQLARVDFGGVRRTVSIAFTPEAHVGDWVLVHVGFALATIDEAEAQATLRLLGEAIDAELRAGSDDGKAVVARPERPPRSAGPAGAP